MKSVRHRLELAGAIVVIGLASQPALSQSQPPSAFRAVDGAPQLLLGEFDPARNGYQVQEYFLSGTAHSHRLQAPPSADGRWDAAIAEQAAYTTRVVVVRPTDSARFNGTVLVEWFNVTGGSDTPAIWFSAKREIVRRGYAYVGVTAQMQGIEGGQAVMGPAPGLRKSQPTRYGELRHPGEAFAYDIYSQAGAALKAKDASGLLGSLRPQRVLAMGQSQSAGFMTTYINAVDRLARVYDGFLVHSRFGSAASIDGVRRTANDPDYVQHVRFRPDLRVPVLTFITETDLIGPGQAGYHASRQPENRRLRVWEVAGTAHADNYVLGGQFVDSGFKTGPELAAIFRPTTQTLAGNLDKPANLGMAHHYPLQAAIGALNRWVATGHAPAVTARIQLASGGAPGQAARTALDAHGLSRGGVRTPWVDVPTARLTGTGNSGSFVAGISGLTEMFDRSALTRLYPGGKADYLKRFESALDAAIRAGHLLPEDRREILEIAEINYSVAP